MESSYWSHDGLLSLLECAEGETLSILASRRSALGADPPLSRVEAARIALFSSKRDQTFSELAERLVSSWPCTVVLTSRWLTSFARRKRLSSPAQVRETRPLPYSRSLTHTTIQSSHPTTRIVCATFSRCSASRCYRFVSQAPIPAPQAHSSRLSVIQEPVRHRKSFPSHSNPPGAPNDYSNPPSPTSYRPRRASLLGPNGASRRPSLGRELFPALPSLLGLEMTLLLSYRRAERTSRVPSPALSPRAATNGASSIPARNASYICKRSFGRGPPSTEEEQERRAA